MKSKIEMGNQVLFLEIAGKKVNYCVIFIATYLVRQFYLCVGKHHTL